MALWLDPVRGVLARVAACLRARAVPPARAVVVLPYAQLLPLVSRLWVQEFPDAFVPRFETTMNWRNALGAVAAQGVDLRFDMALDLLTAQTLLTSAGLGGQQESLAALLVESAYQLAPLAAGQAPDQRQAWAQEARRGAIVGMESVVLKLEAAVAQIAVEWVVASAYATDVFYEGYFADTDLWVWLQGLNSEPLVAGLQAVWGTRMVCLDLAPDHQETTPPRTVSAPGMHPCQDGEDEAQRTVACALRHIEAGRFPLALVSSDRALTRRVRCLLEGMGVQMRDETGWKLSTSAPAARVMALLQAATWIASTDAVMNCLKAGVVDPLAADELEAQLRRAGLREWRDAGVRSLGKAAPAVADVVQKVDAWRARCASSKTLVAWIADLGWAFTRFAQWEPLQADSPGRAVLAALRLSSDVQEENSADLSGAPGAGRMWDLRAFTQWVNQVLEAASYQPDYPAQEQLVILPMSQMLGRPFAAVLLAGCDEVRLNPGAEPPGAWTAAQRAALGLPSRATLEAAFRAAWRHALQTPVVEVLWRTSDDAGESLMPSALVQLLQWECEAVWGRSSTTDPRDARPLTASPQLPPQPLGAALPLKQWSASAYEDLRQCPYRFFALRQLGLREAEELDTELDKRDFGVWLHDVLSRFHQTLAEQPSDDIAAQRAMLEAASAEVSAAMALPEGEFLPFAASWPALREGYLHWVQDHALTLARFASAETSHTQYLGPLKLVGRIDRMDTLPDGQVLVVDYKTEPLAKTRARVKEPLEDTQMAFYAALLPHDTVRGMYVNVSEKDGTKSCEQGQLVEARDALVEGLLADACAIAGGAVLPALGEGVACDFCDARGLCRKDSWGQA
ncbi:MAG: exonuclease [Burkholderiales bacterium PBB4]|nr:MAG: exonuclease [Burkholderiales bacterium PBB4]